MLHKMKKADSNDMKPKKGFKESVVQPLQKKVVQPFVDLILGRTVSKKLTVFVVATVALFHDKIGGTEWSVFAGIYVLGLLWLNHLQEMANARKQINDFRGADSIKIIPGLEDNQNYD